MHPDHRNRQVLLDYLEGMSSMDIAKEIQMSDGTVLNILKRPEVLAEMERIVKAPHRERLEMRLEIRAERALDIIVQVMEGKLKSDLQYRAAKDLLDRHPIFRTKEAAEALGKGMGDEIIAQLAKAKARVVAKDGPVAVH